MLPKLCYFPRDVGQTSQTAFGYILGVLEHHRDPNHHSCWAGHWQYSSHPTGATSLHQWLLSGTWSNLSHLPTHLSTAKTGTFCSQVAQMPGNITPSVKEDATGEATQHLVPCLLPFTVWGHGDGVGLIHSLQSLVTRKIVW